MKITIITVCYNSGKTIKDTIESVLAQNYKNFEYIIIDGASTDGSVDLLKQYSDIIDYKISEKDNGIYNAMNKGIKYAHGEYCLFLNSGDMLYDNKTIENVIPLLGASDFMTGDTVCVYNNGKKSIWKAPTQITTYLMAIYSLSHQATFIKASLLKRRHYREDLKIVADWEQMFYEIVVNGCSYQCLNMKICEFEYGGISSSKPEQRERERRRILDEHLSKKMQEDIVHPNLLIRIAVLADYGSRYYKVLEFFARVIRRIYGR